MHWRLLHTPSGLQAVAAPRSLTGCPAGAQRGWPSTGRPAEWPSGEGNGSSYFKTQEPRRGLGLKPSSPRVTGASGPPPSIIPDTTELSIT